MDDSTPTHFNVILLATGLIESILAAALAKAGYSVLQLDQAPYYGDSAASLSLSQLIDWANSHSHSHCLSNSALLERSQRFSLSLHPMLLTATGNGIDVLVRSKVAAYLNFGMLEGIALATVAPSSSSSAEAQNSTNKVARVPASKADVFSDPTLSLVEKRRLTKLLLFAAGDEVLEDSPLLSNPARTFEDCLSKSFSLSSSVINSLQYALALCTSSQDLALPTLYRLRTFIRSSGRYGPSPFLVGHYGGAGDLVGAYSRVCAVFGGGQILGRLIAPLEYVELDDDQVEIMSNPIRAAPSPPSVPIEASPKSTKADGPSLVNAVESVSAPAKPPIKRKRLALPVLLEPALSTTFTADWIVASRSHASLVVPEITTSPASPSSSSSSPSSLSTVYSFNAIVILPAAIPFPPPLSSDNPTPSEDPVSEVLPTSSEPELERPQAAAPPTASQRDQPDSNLFVFPPQAFSDLIGTTTVLQVGSGTLSCPDDDHVLYISAPLLLRISPNELATTAESILRPYLTSLLSLSPLSIIPSFTLFYPLSSSPLPPPESIPPNVLLVPNPISQGRAEGLVCTIDEAVVEAEKMFWTIVKGGSASAGQIGTTDSTEGIEFFARAPQTDNGEE